MSSCPTFELETALANLLGRRHCVVTGRAASALYISFKSLPVPGKVVIPTVACPSPATVSMYAGWQPLFCDISLDDFNMCPLSLRAILQQHPDVSAIMPIHLYGQSAPMQKILDIAREHGIPVIEDAAQALGASYQGKLLGSFGDVSVISFGHTKTLDVGWGGAALTDDDGIAARMREHCKELPPRPANINQLFEEWRKVYYTLISLAEMNPRMHELFIPLPSIFQDMYLFALDEEVAPQISKSLGHLELIVNARRTNARAYRSALIHPKIHHPILDEHDAPWRYTFITDRKNQQAITTALRVAGIDVSNWYPPLHRWYKTGRAQPPESFKNADKLAQGVVNLWVDPRVTMERITRTCEIILSVLDNSNI